MNRKVNKSVPFSFFLMPERAVEDINVPVAQRRPPAPSLKAIAKRHTSRDEAIVAAYASGVYSYQDVAKYFGVHFTTVGRIIRARRSKG